MSLEYILIRMKAGQAAEAYDSAWVRHKESPHIADSEKLCAVLSQTYEDKLNDLLRYLNRQTSTIETSLLIDRALQSKRSLIHDRLALELSVSA